MSNNDAYLKELDVVDREDLAKAEGSNLFRMGAGPDRYGFYRRKGYAPADALAYAIAWLRNTGEQAARRKDHLTGCPV